MMHIVISIGLTIAFYGLLTYAEWETKMQSTNFEMDKFVSDFDPSIVVQTSSVKTWSRCLYTCSGVSTLQSVFYDRNKFICYCNNGTVATTTDVDPGLGIQYASVVKRYEQQEHTNGDQRFLITNGIHTSCSDIHSRGYIEEAMYYAQNSTNCWREQECTDGWTVFQRRMDGSVDFYRDWEDYVNGFGDPSGEFWLGLEDLHQLTKDGGCELMILLHAECSNPIQTSGYAKYSSFEIGSAATNYTLSVTGFSGNVGNSFSGHSGKMFTTRDVDNDENPFNCALSFKGGWWYGSCHSSNLNGLYLNGSHTSYAKGIEWFGTWGMYYSLIRTEMKLRCS